MPDPKYFQQVEMPDGSILEVKDTVARNAIAGGVKYIGKLYVSEPTYTHLTDGDTRASVEVVDTTASGGHKKMSSTAGYLVIDDTDEYIYSGTSWSKFGSEGALGDFAYADEGRVTVPVSSYGNPTPNTTSTKATVNISENTSGNLAITGTFTQPSFSKSVTLTGTSEHGTSSKTIDADFTETIPSGKSGFTAHGTVSAPVISVDTAGSTTTIKNPTSKTVVTSVSVSEPASTAATNEKIYMSYDGTTETLSFKKIIAATGASITTSNVSVRNGDATYSASAPTLSMTPFYASTTGTYTDATGAASVSGTVSGPTTGGAYVPKKYQVDVSYDKTTSVTQGTKTDSTVTRTVTPYTGS